MNSEKNIFLRKRKEREEPRSPRGKEGRASAGLGSSTFRGLSEPPGNCPSAAESGPGGLGFGRAWRALWGHITPTSHPARPIPLFPGSGPLPVLPVRILRALSLYPLGFETPPRGSRVETGGEMGHLVAGKPRLDKLKKLNLGVGRPNRHPGTEKVLGVIPPSDHFGQFLFVSRRRRAA